MAAQRVELRTGLDAGRRGDDAMIGGEVKDRARGTLALRIAAKPGDEVRGQFDLVDLEGRHRGGRAAAAANERHAHAEPAQFVDQVAVMCEVARRHEVGDGELEPLRRKSTLAESGEDAEAGRGIAPLRAR